MQKTFMLCLLCCLSCFYSAAQQPETSLAFLNESKESLEPMSISVREVLKDTVIKGRNFHKFKWLTFTDYEKEKTVGYRYEHFSNRQYILLDQALNTIHDFKLEPKQQQGVMFGKKGTVLRVGVGMEGDAIAGSVDDYYTRFYVQGVDPCYLQSDDLRCRIWETRDGNIEQRALYGSEGVMTALQHQPFQPGYHLSKGDEVQFVLQDLALDPETGQRLPYSDVFSYCYRGDTLINGQKHLIITGVDYLAWKFRVHFETLVRPVENGFYINQQIFVPVPVFETTFRIENTGEDNRNELKVELCIYDTLDGQVIPYYSSDDDAKTVFPLFPAFFPTYRERVTYLKKDGKVYGKNRLPDESTDKSPVRNIRAEGDTLAIEVLTYPTQRMRVVLYDNGQPSVLHEQGALFATLEGFLDFRKLRLKIPSLHKGKMYRLDVEFYHYGSMKVVSQEFTAE